MACTVDCLSSYSCDSSKEFLVSAQEGAVYAPFVEMRIGDKILTVGNASSPPVNHAAIKSFEYGTNVGLGLGINVEIIDQGGLMHKTIIEALNKTTALALDDTMKCSVRFGWIVTTCDGNSRLITNEDSGDKLYFTPLSLKTQYENGLIKLSLEAGSHVKPWTETRYTKTLGSQDNKMSLKQALRILFTQFDPKVRNVLFRNKDGKELEFASSDGGPDGPMGYWPMDQQNAPAIARKWLSALTTTNNLGILMLYDPSGPNVIFQEDPNSKNCCNGNLGTYIVNGGNCSTVLSFNPEISWKKGLVPGGGGSLPGAASGDSDKLIKPVNNKIEKVGSQTGPTVQQHEYMWRIPDQMAAKNANAIAAHLDANSNYEIEPSVSAELTIMGRPDIVNPRDFAGKSVSIIVMNPFYISNNCSWLTTSNCNKMLSNKKWMINGVNHKISNGSFVTNLKVWVIVPNISTDANDPLGGMGCGTERFENSQAREVEGT